MNKRIQELYKQAYGYFPCPAGEPETEKFAELIVQDCLDVLNSRFMGDLNREDMEVKRCIEDVKEHFGVEVGVNPEKDEILPDEEKKGHLCPYNMEINDDYQTLCDCDEEATEQCALDV